MLLSLAPCFFYQLSQLHWKCVQCWRFMHTWKRISKSETWGLSQHAPEDPLMQMLTLRSVLWDLSPSGIRFEQCALGCHAEGQASSRLLCLLLRCREAEPDYLIIFFHGILFYSLVYFTVLRTCLVFQFLVQRGPSGERILQKELPGPQLPRTDKDRDTFREMPS